MDAETLVASGAIYGHYVATVVTIIFLVVAAAAARYGQRADEVNLLGLLVALVNGHLVPRRLSATSAQRCDIHIQRIAK